jgi:hypothetical protein
VFWLIISGCQTFDHACFGEGQILLTKHIQRPAYLVETVCPISADVEQSVTSLHFAEKFSFVIGS